MHCVTVASLCSIMESQGEAAGCWAEGRQCDTVQPGTYAPLHVSWVSVCESLWVGVHACTYVHTYIHMFTRDYFGPCPLLIQTCEVKKQHPVPAGMFTEAVEGEGLGVVLG